MSEEQLGCCNPLRSDIKDYLTWQIGHKEDKHHPFQGELKEGRNPCWHWKEMELFCMHKTSFLAPAQPT